MAYYRSIAEAVQEVERGMGLVDAALAHGAAGRMERERERQRKVEHEQAELQADRDRGAE